jgi:hypothetical protein
MLKVFFFAFSDFGRPIFAIAALIPPQHQYTFRMTENQAIKSPS